MNLLATSLMTHAYLYAPADKHKYKTWVLEYLRAWEGMLLHLTLAKRPRTMRVELTGHVQTCTAEIYPPT